MMRDRRKAARQQRVEEAQAHEAAARKRIWHKPSPFAWAAIIAATALLGYLSFWQIERLQWKTSLMAAISAHQYDRAYAGLPALSDDQTLPDDLAFARFTLSGRYLHDMEAHLAARYYNSQLGYHVLTPFELMDGQIVLINRGWVHVDYKDPATRPDSQPEGIQHITAMLRMDNDRNTFTPEHDVTGNMWFWRDVAGIAQARDIDLYPYAFDALYDISASNRPIPSDGLVRLRNDHLQYAMTWGLIGISGIIMFGMYHYRPRAQEEK